MVVVIDTSQIVDETSFHAMFAQAFGFPEFYGRNMDAWIDCMSYLGEPTANMSTLHCATGQTITLRLDSAADFSVRLPKLFQTLIESSAFVNWRRAVDGNSALLALAYYS